MILEFLVKRNRKEKHNFHSDAIIYLYLTPPPPYFVYLICKDVIPAQWWHLCKWDKQKIKQKTKESSCKSKFNKLISKNSTLYLWIEMLKMKKILTGNLSWRDWAKALIAALLSSIKLFISISSTTLNPDNAKPYPTEIFESINAILRDFSLRVLL